MTATASADAGILQVEFFVDGSSIGIDNTTEPYSASWVTDGLDGGHTLTAVATANGEGIEATSADVNVTVDNSTPTVGAPAAPTNLTMSVKRRFVMLKWSDNSDNETGFNLYRCPPP